MTIRIHEPKSNSDTTSRGWVTVRFDALAENIVEHVEVPSKSGYDRFVGGDHLDPGSLKITRWGSTNDVEAQKLLFKKGHILFGKRNAYLRKVAYADFDGVCSAHMLVLKAKPDYIIEEFLPFFMQTDQFWERALMISEGSMSPTIKWKILAQKEFVIPPKDEQQRIADILWAADEDILKTVFLQEQMQICKQTLLQNFFDPHTIKQEREALKLLTLADILSYASDGPFGSKLKTEHYTSKGAHLIRIQNLGDGSFNNRDKAYISSSYYQGLIRYALKPGDIVVAGLGDEANALGRACLIPKGSGPAVNKAGLFLLTRKYFYYQTRIPYKFFEQSFCTQSD